MSISFVINIFVYSCGFDDTHQLVLRDYIFSTRADTQIVWHAIFP